MATGRPDGSQMGKEHATAEEVLRPAPTVDEAEARVGQHLLGKFECLGQRVPVVGRPAQAKTTHHLAVVPTRAQVVAGQPGVGRPQEALVVPLHGPLHGVEQRGAALVVAARLPVLVQRDAGPVGQEPHGVDEVEVVHGPDEADGVARLLATEAVVHPVLGVDAEGRRLLGVERAQAAPAPAHLLEQGVLADEGDDVGGRPDLSDLLVRYTHTRNVPRRCPSPDWPTVDGWPSPSTASAPSPS